MNEVIYAGSYTLTLSDPAPTNPDSAILKCAQYKLSYFLNTTTVPSPEQCENLESLPRVLVPGADGSLRFYGDKYFIPKDPPRIHNYIEITVTQWSYARIFSYSPDGSDVDFYLYKNGSDSSTLFKTSLGLDSKESAVWLLPPQSNPYTLDVYFYRAAATSPCNYFAFEFALKSNTTVQTELLCPVHLPNEVNQVPTSALDLRGGYDRDFYGSDSTLR